MNKNSDDEQFTEIAGKNDAGRRVDRIVRSIADKSVPLGRIYSGFRTGAITINGKKCKPSLIIQEGDILAISHRYSDIWPVPQTGNKTQTHGHGSKEKPDIEALVICKNKNICAVNKPSGTLTHGTESLHQAFLDYISGSISPSLAFTPSPLHRLDRNTSGIVVFGTTIDGTREFTHSLREGKIHKIYCAILDGALRQETEWEDTIHRDGKTRTTRITDSTGTGKEAILKALPLWHSGKHTFCLLFPGTGRTHQIRAQCAHHGYPLWGDRKYGGTRTGFSGYMLHAWHLALPPVAEFAGCGRITASLPKKFIHAAERFFPGFSLSALNKHLPD